MSAHNCPLTMIGPLNPVEIRSLGDLNAQESDLKRLRCTLDSLKKSIFQTEASIHKIVTAQTQAVNDILSSRSVDMTGGKRAILKTVNTDGTIRIDILPPLPPEHRS